MSTETIILAGVAVYMAAMLGVGYYAAGKTHSVTEFVLAGRGLPVWLLSMSVIATWFGGSTMIGGTIISRIAAAANTPFCASLMFGAAMARWVMTWLVLQ